MRIMIFINIYVHNDIYFLLTGKFPKELVYSAKTVCFLAIKEYTIDIFVILKYTNYNKRSSCMKCGPVSVWVSVSGLWSNVIKFTNPNLFCPSMDKWSPL
jgi:hypothetical protein